MLTKWRPTGNPLFVRPQGIDAAGCWVRLNGNVKGVQSIQRFCSILSATSLPASNAAIESELWDDELGCYVDRDLIAGTTIRERVGSGLAPLYAGIPTGARFHRLLDTLRSLAVELPAGGWALPSLAPEDPRFQAVRYWRGPVWINVNWLLYRGLIRYGFDRDDRARWVGHLLIGQTSF